MHNYYEQYWGKNCFDFWERHLTSFQEDWGQMQDINEKIGQRLKELMNDSLKGYLDLMDYVHAADYRKMADSFTGANKIAETQSRLITKQKKEIAERKKTITAQNKQIAEYKEAAGIQKKMISDLKQEITALKKSVSEPKKAVKEDQKKADPGKK